MAAPRNHAKAGGRKKGVPNKITADLKAMILGALEQAENNANAFLTLVGKVLPMTVAGDKDNPLALQVIERRIVKANNSNG